MTNGNLGKHIDGFHGVDVGHGVGKRNYEIMLLKIFVEEELCLMKKQSGAGHILTVENETKSNIVTTRKEHGQFLQNGYIIPEELQHTLVVVDMEKRKIVKRTQIGKGKACCQMILGKHFKKNYFTWLCLGFSICEDISRMAC